MPQTRSNSSLCGALHEPNHFTLLMNPNQETHDTWNKLADLYQEKFMKAALYNESYDFICRAISQPGAKLLDIGCGPGNITQYLLNKRPDFEVLGIDIAPNMVALAQQNNPTASFAVMDTRDIARLNGPFDGIIGGFCLPYLSPDERRHLLADAQQLLQPGGLLYLSFVEGEAEQSGFKSGSGGRVYFHYHPLRELQTELQGLGFDALQVFQLQHKISEDAFEWHTIVVAKKTAGF